MNMSDFVVDKDRPAGLQAPRWTGYAWHAAEVGPEDIGCLARMAQCESGRTDYFIKSKAGGIFFNPLSDPVQDLGRTVGGMPVYDFRRVTKTSFEAYLQFLATGKVQFYRTAGRM